MRAILHPLAFRAAFSPIEIIVTFFIFGTLAYFHVLSAIKHSSFLAPTYPSTLRPAHALLRENEWIGVSESKWLDAKLTPANGVVALEMQQIMFSLDPAPVYRSGVVRRTCLQACFQFSWTLLSVDTLGHDWSHPRVRR